MVKAVTAIVLQALGALEQGGRGQAQHKEDKSPVTGLA